MSDPHPPPPLAPQQQPGARPISARVLPPLQEVLRGLDSRELDSASVFDQLFDLPPAGGAALTDGR